MFASETVDEMSAHFEQKGSYESSGREGVTDTLERFFRAVERSVQVNCSFCGNRVENLTAVREAVPWGDEVFITFKGFCELDLEEVNTPLFIPASKAFALLYAVAEEEVPPF